MITAKLTQLRQAGFSSLPGEKPRKTYWLEKELEKGSILAIARKIENGIYEIIRARDTKSHYYNKRELELLEEGQGLNNLAALVTGLRQGLPDPGWLGINPELKKAFFEIAKTPRDRSIEHTLALAWKKIKEYQGKERSRLEWYLEGAITAHVVGEPERFNPDRGSTTKLLSSQPYNETSLPQSPLPA